ncbi:Haemagluttinin repeat-containing protein, partial [Propionispira arboris]
MQSGTVPAAQGGTAISGTTFAGTAPSTSITSGQLSTPVLTAVQSGTAPAAANGSVAATVSKGDGAVSFTIPQSGLYKMDSKPTAKYVVETDSRFANYKSFISSDYMLQRLNYDPAMTQKRLGDAFYEQKLVNDQITQMTGRRYLSGFDNSDAEYKALMDSGVAQAKSMNLVTGMELTAAQAANLTQDLVWMVEREVTLADGTKEKVLVPQIYLCKASTIDLKSSGALIAADTVDFKLSGNLTNSGTITGSVLTSIQANNLLNQNGGKIGGTGTTSLVAVNDILNQSGTITGGQVFVAAGRDIRNETTSSAVTASTSANGHSWTGSNTVIGAKATIESQGDLTLLAGRDISLQGGAITAVGNAAINAGHDFIVGTVVSQNKGADKSSNQAFSYTDIQNVTSTLSGNNVAVASQGDIRLSGVKVNALSGLSVAAQGNLVVNAVKDIHTENETYNERGDHYNAHSIDETVVGSNLQAGKNATVAALNSAADKGNISITGSSVTSQNGVITIAAAKTVDIQNDMEKHESLKELHSSGHGFFSSTSDSRDYSLLNQVKGSTVSGDQVNIQSGKDIIVHGSNVVGTNDVNLAAQDNINITSAQQTGKEDHYYHETSSGIFSGGVGFTIGKRSITTTDAQQNITQVASTVGSTNGNVNIAAGNDVKVIASDIISGKDTNVLGKNVTIESANNSNQEQQTYKFSQSGISVSVGNQTLNNINSVYQPLTRSTQVEDSRLKALYGYKAATAANNVLNGKTPDGTKAASKDNSLKVSVSIGTSKQQSETDAAQVTVQQSTITAGGNVNVIAAGSGKKDAEGKAVDGDITIVGSNVKGQDISLTAARDVNLKSAENTTNTKTTNSSSSAGVGVEMSAKSAPGFFASGSKANTDGNGNTITQTDTSVTAANTLTIKAGQDINLVGAQAKGETVKVEAGRNLNLESQQAVDNYKETS